MDALLAGAPAIIQRVGRPVSVKGVCTLPDGRVLLCHNHGGGWELPGGRPEPDEVAFLDPDLLGPGELPGVYRRLIARQFRG